MTDTPVAAVSGVGPFALRMARGLVPLLLLVAWSQPSGSQTSGSQTHGSQPAELQSQESQSKQVPPVERRCAVPPELAPSGVSLPGLARALRNRAIVPTIVVLSPQSRAAVGYPPLLQASLGAALAPQLQQRRLRVEVVGKPLAATGELAALIGRQVLPLKPALVIWQVGRTDARRRNPPYRFAGQLEDGLELLDRHGIDTIVLDMQYHPQFEALFRTDEYRNHLRWVVSRRSLPMLRRYEMIEYWLDEGLIDLDAGNPEAERNAFDTIQGCLAFQLTRMIAGAARPGAVRPAQ